MDARKQPRRILLVRNDRVGDLVLTLPAIEALRAHFPQVHLSVLVSRYAGPLVAGHPAINELIYDDPAEGAWALGRRLARLRFDAALVINTNTRNCLAVRVARIRRRVCWGYKPIGWLAATHPVKLHRSRPPIHEAAFALAFAGQLGVPIPATIPSPILTIDASVRQRVSARIARELGSEGPLFGVHPGNKNSAYNWPASRYAELVSRLAAHGRVLLTGSPEERTLLELVSDRLSVRLRNRVVQFTDLALPELAAAIAEQDVLVVSSTGPMHLAGVLGTPTVALFSPHPAHVPAKWAPLGSNHSILIAPLATGQQPDVPKEQGTDLMSRISVDEVLAAALRHASGNQASNPKPRNVTSPRQIGSLRMAVTTSRSRAKRRAIFLDRDGTLNVDVGYAHRVEDLLLIDNVCPGLRKLQALGFALFITTNQSGIARGYFSEAQMRAFNAALCELLRGGDIEIAGIYYCPFHPTAGRGAYRRESPLRKPAPGMLLQAAAEHGLDLAASFAIGDKKSDVAAGRAAGCRTILVHTGLAGTGEPESTVQPDFVAADLLSAAEQIEAAWPVPTGIPRLDDYAYPPSDLDGPAILTE